MWCNVKIVKINVSLIFVNVFFKLYKLKKMFFNLFIVIYIFNKYFGYNEVFNDFIVDFVIS